jgi:hypothetical protein
MAQKKGPKGRKKGQKAPTAKTGQAGTQVRQAQPGAAAPIALGYDPNGKMEQRSIVRVKDGWSEYELDDGSTLKTRTALINVRRAVDQFLPSGDPLYIIQGASVIETQAPDALKKKKT